MIRGLRSTHILRHLPGTALVCGLLLVVALAVNVLGERSIQSTVANSFVLMVLVVGLGAYVGSTGVLSFGHASFAALAAYVSAVLSIPLALKIKLLPNLPSPLSDTSLPVILSVAIAVSVTVLVGWLVGRVVTVLSGAAAAIATLGLLIIANSVIIGASNYTRGAQALYGIPASAGLWTCAICACVSFALSRQFKFSRTGLIARAARDNLAAARSIGISVRQSREPAWLLSVFLVALGGALLAHRLTVISPKEFYFAQSFEWLAILIIGGILSVTGHVVGTVAVVLLIEFLRRLEEGVTIGPLHTPQIFGLTEAGLGIAILLTFMWRGTGLLGRFEIDDLPWLKQTYGVPRAQTYPHFNSQGRASAEHTLSIRGLSKNYGGVVALSEVSLDIASGQIVGLIGPNGSGKSTLLGCVSGAIPTTGGSVRLGARDITGAPPERVVSAGLARTFQNIRLFGSLSVLENVEAAIVARGSGLASGDSHSEAAAYLHLLEIGHLSDQLAAELSYGDQRRLEIARAMACRPSLLLLDEPAAGMNEQESMALVAVLKEFRERLDIGILIVEHDLRLIDALTETLYVLDKGKIIASGPTSTVLRSPSVALAYTGMAANHSTTRRYHKSN